MRVRVGVLLVVLAVVASLTGVDASAGAPQLANLGGRRIRVATDATYPPFEMLDRNKNIIGYDIDLIREICRLVNCRPEIKSVAWEGILPGVQKGDYDVAISGITITEERRKVVDFTDPYIEVGQTVLVRADEARIRGVEDLRDKSVAVQIGTTNDELATRLHKAGKIRQVKRYRTFDLAVQALLNKDVDAGTAHVGGARGEGGATQGRVEPGGPKGAGDQRGCAGRRGEGPLPGAFSAARGAPKEDGTLDRLYRKWFVEWKPTK